VTADQIRAELREAALRIGLREVARRAGMTPASASRKLAGHRRMTVSELERLAAACGRRVTVEPLEPGHRSRE
jgi:transcriptional regulator with XRE-family HTH domain